MAFAYKNYTLNNYGDDPWYDREIGLFETIIDKLPAADSDAVTTQHRHSRLATPTAGVNVLTVSDSSAITFPFLSAGVCTVNGSGVLQTGAAFSAADVTYTNAGYTGIATVKDALDKLLYMAPTISSFTNDAGTVYKGSTITAFNAAWTINGTIASQTLTGKTPLVGDRAASYTGLSLTTDTTYTLTATDGTSTPSATTTIRFNLRKYYDTSVTATPNSSTITSGSVVVCTDTAASRVLATTNITGAGNYIYYSYPAAWGAVNLIVNGFPASWNITTVSITSAEGDTENYTCYTSPNPIVGTISLQATAA